VIHCDVPSAAEVRPSREAAYFQVTNGRCSRTASSQASLPRALGFEDAGLDLEPRQVTLLGGVGDGVDDAGDPGVDQRLGAGAGAALRVAGFEGDDRGRAARLATGGAEGGYFGVVLRVVGVKALTDRLAGRREQDAADGRVGCGTAERAVRERDGTAHRRDLVLVRHRLSLRARTQPIERRSVGRAT
jgi:hypothetical protein